MTAHDPPSEVTTTRVKLIRGSSLNWIHWLVVAMSVVATLAAAYVAQHQLDEKIEARFARESAQAVELVSERMRRYEDALWGGVGAIQAAGGRVDHEHWLAFCRELNIHLKYPGINGIGVIDYVRADELPSYLQAQRTTRPDFRVHPRHGGDERWPIVYVEPVEQNRAAVGLDIAHEANRYRAAKKTRDTGTPQITAPIVLVQDSEKTPGFLFYVPIYEGGGVPATEPERRDKFAGLVYAPFIVRRLMEGVLRSEARHVGVRIRDDSETLFDELTPGRPEFDVEALFKSSRTVDIYGRTWTFDVWSGASFRAATASDQPLTILLAGIFIDGMLFGLFVLLSRSNKKAVQYADLAHAELSDRARRLAASNRELQDFASVAAHDLQEPLRKIQAFGSIIATKFAQQLPAEGQDYFSRMQKAAERMSNLISDLLELARIQSQGRPFQPTDLNRIANDVLCDLDTQIATTGATLKVGHLPTIDADRTQMRQLFQNLVGNALKFRHDGVAPVVELMEASGDSSPASGASITGNKNECEILVRDNGIGLSPEYAEKIFTVFQRLHGRAQYDGTGIGLALCRRIAERHSGTITAGGRPGEGATFVVRLPRKQG